MKDPEKRYPSYEELLEGYKELDASHNYWVVNYNTKADQIDKLCVKAAESLGNIDYQLWRHKTNKKYMGEEAVCELMTKRETLENVLIHFTGFIDIDFLIANDLAPEGIERNETRRERHHSIRAPRSLL
jgi:hypothetical protein